MSPPAKELGDYRLLRRIGAGGMAEVFLAEKVGAEGFARTVAIKTIIAQGAEEEAVNLFLDEARTASYLNHPAIVQTLDLGFENETLFIVMEYIAGPSLSRVLKDLRKASRFLPPEIVAYAGARVAAALDYASERVTTPDGHRLHLVHRDVSPQNIMMTRNGMVKLTDFGVARASTQTHRTRTGQVRGKAAYMAPEQVRAKPLDGRADVFALGSVIYEALTNKRAFQRKTDINSMRAILTDEVTPIRELNASAPQSLIEVVTKALRKKPEDRWQTAGEMQSALEACYRHRASSLIEADIKALLDEIFGTADTYGDADGMPVEAWQPTVANAGIEATPRKLQGSGLSPRIKEMLATPPSSPSQETIAAAPTPASLPSLPATVPFAEPPPTEARSALTTPPQKRPPLLLVGLPLLGIALAGLGWIALRGAPTPTPAQPEQPVAPAPKVTAAPQPEAPPPPTAVLEPPPPRPKERRRPPPKTVVKKKPNPRPPPPPKRSQESKAAFEKRLVATWLAHKKKKSAHAERLGALVTDLRLKGEVTPRMRKVLAEAEAALP